MVAFISILKAEEVAPSLSTSTQRWKGWLCVVSCVVARAFFLYFVSYSQCLNKKIICILKKIFIYITLIRLFYFINSIIKI